MRTCPGRHTTARMSSGAAAQAPRQKRWWSLNKDGPMVMLSIPCRRSPLMASTSKSPYRGNRINRRFAASISGEREASTSKYSVIYTLTQLSRPLPLSFPSRNYMARRTSTRCRITVGREVGVRCASVRAVSPSPSSILQVRTHLLHLHECAPSHLLVLLPPACRSEHISICTSVRPVTSSSSSTRPAGRSTSPPSAPVCVCRAVVGMGVAMYE